MCNVYAFFPVFILDVYDVSGILTASSGINTANIKAIPKIRLGKRRKKLPRLVYTDFRERQIYNPICLEADADGR